VKSFVLRYERPTGHLTVEVFEGVDHGGRAFRRRLEVERHVAPQTEVIVLHADSEDDLRATHGRYFGGAPSLMVNLQQETQTSGSR